MKKLLVASQQKPSLKHPRVRGGKWSSWGQKASNIRASPNLNPSHMQTFPFLSPQNSKFQKDFLIPNNLKTCFGIILEKGG